jgi:hypothetical protein
MINDKIYEDLIRNGERVEWYGSMVPEGLLNNLVKTWSNNLTSEIDKLESTLSDLRGNSLEKRKSYIQNLKISLQNAPYSLNGDFYLKKKTRIESQIKEENKNKKTTKHKTKTSVKTTKNSNLIFRKNKK